MAYASLRKGETQISLIVKLVPLPYGEVLFNIGLHFCKKKSISRENERLIFSLWLFTQNHLIYIYIWK